MRKDSIFIFNFLIFALISFSVALYVTKPTSVPRSQYLVPPLTIQYLMAGLKVQASDSFWLRSIQDFDYCDKPVNKMECQGKSWLYEILNLTTDLDAKFYEAYYYGGLALTIIISDYEGATRIFDKGIAAFPKRWNLNYAAGYHALFEEKDKAKAARLFLAASQNGAPQWLGSLAARLAVEGGEKDFAIQILKDLIETSEDPKLVERLKVKLNDSLKNK